ncbi:uncharacterized protein LOC143879291 isoform X6 [Tasmannia lanceolata]|uniref:uncharacterized protein LOC143879291 isoform X6 n=1 Tax=Tasmannia lanceolata TaxID=3420 RepID=UPI004062CDC4
MKMICRHSPQMNGLEGSLSQGMSFLKLHPSYPQISSLPVSTLPHHHAFSSTFPPSIPPRKPCLRNPRISDSETPVSDKYPETLVSTGFEDLATDGAVYQNTLRLVECSMFAAVAGLAYFLSNSLAIELMHGLVGLAMGSLWRLGANWGLSIVLCTFVRAMGATGFVLITSFLIRENILALITINIHASVSYILAAIGINTIPSMNAIYTIFGSLVMLNSGFFVFLLHILYAVFLTKLGMKASLTLPRWLEKAI